MARSWLGWLTPWWWPDADLFGPSAAADGDANPPTGRAGNLPDGGVDGFLGVRWSTWGRLAVGGWLALFVASWVGMLWAWDSQMTASLWLLNVVLGGVAMVNGLPGAAALLDPGVRARLLSLPEAAALASLTLSALVGLGGFAAASLLTGTEAGLVGAGIVIGIVSFPLSFGLVFPLAIPLACSFVVWAVVHAYGRLSRPVFVLLASVSAAGWLGVALFGAALGAGA